MDFGRLKSIESVDFTLPPDDPASAHALGGVAVSPDSARVYLGAPRWSAPGFSFTVR